MNLDPKNADALNYLGYSLAEEGRDLDKALVMELFNEQPADYREAVLGPVGTPRFATEAGRPELWCQYTGSLDRVHGISHFGASAPAGKLCQAYGFTPEALVAKIKAALAL